MGSFVLERKSLPLAMSAYLEARKTKVIDIALKTIAKVHKLAALKQYELLLSTRNIYHLRFSTLRR